MTYYLGASGALTALPDPEAGLSMPVERIGGSHQLLGGGKVRDTIGYSRSWNLSWTAITLAQYGLLEGFYYGFTGPGPFYFFDDEQTNLLPLNVATGTDTLGTTAGFTPNGTATLQSSTGSNTNWNALGGPFPANGTRTLQGSIPTGFAANTVFAIGPNVPVVAGQTFTLSAYVSSAGGNAFGIYCKIVWLASDGSTSVGTVQSNTVAAGPAGRMVASGAAPSTAYYARLQIYTDTTNASGSTQFAYSDGWQFEMNNAVSTWQPGVPAPLVTVESLSRSTPLAGICDAQMTLVQVG